MIETYTRNAKIIRLRPYDYLAHKNDHVELTEWRNGEGFDVDIFHQEGTDSHFSFTWGEWSALQVLVGYAQDPE